MATRPTPSPKGDTIPRRELYPVAETRQLLGGISRSKLSELVASGELEPRRIGRRTLFRREDIEAFARGESA